jgi:hypothetical protein
LDPPAPLPFRLIRPTRSATSIRVEAPGRRRRIASILGGLSLPLTASAVIIILAALACPSLPLAIITRHLQQDRKLNGLSYGRMFKESHMSSTDLTT